MLVHLRERKNKAGEFIVLGAAAPPAEAGAAPSQAARRTLARPASTPGCPVPVRVPHHGHAGTMSQQDTVPVGARLLLRARREVEVAVALAGRRGCGVGCHIGAHRAAARRRARAGQFAFVVAVVRVRTPCVYSAGDAWVYSCVLEQ